jgi:hypothetical protein
MSRQPEPVNTVELQRLRVGCTGYTGVSRPGLNPLAELATPARAKAFLDRWPGLPISRSMHMPDPKDRSIEAACRLLDEEAKAK